jgi:hypothetical protein
LTSFESQSSRLFVISGQEQGRQAAEQNIPFDSVPDDSGTEDEYKLGEEDTDSDDEELGEEEDDEDTMAKKTPKKAAAANSKGASAPSPAAGAATSEDDLSTRMNRMSMRSNTTTAPAGTGRRWSMEYQCPWLLTEHNEGSDTMLTAEIFVPMFPRDHFIPDITNGGSTLELQTSVPRLFIDQSRVLTANASTGFNENTYKAQAFRAVCEEIDAHFNMMPSIYGRPQSIPLPFQVEERIVNWEIQAYVNENDELTDGLGSQQFFAILTVEMRKLRTKRRTTGGFRVIGTNPNGTVPMQANP